MVKARTQLKLTMKNKNNMGGKRKNIFFLSSLIPF